MRFFLNRKNCLAKFVCFFLVVLALPTYATTLKFCYQDQPLSPFYSGAGSQVPKVKPGATIEHLQKLVANVPGLQLELVRYPWNRCLKYLQTGVVDAVVANYSKNRESLGVFPSRNGKPDQSKMFTRQDVCFVTTKQLAKHWNWRFFDVAHKVSVTLQTPRFNLEPAIATKFTFIQASVDANSLQMLTQGRVQVVTQVCQIMEQKIVAKSFDPKSMEILTPPVQELHGYLVFSHQFYQKQPAIAQALWQRQADPQVRIYQQYME